MTDSQQPWEEDVPPETERAESPENFWEEMNAHKYAPGQTDDAPKQPPPRTLLWYKDIEPVINEEEALIDGLLSSTALSLIAGGSGSTKTFLALHLALCIASGTDFLGKPVKQGGVVYIAAEAGESIRNRIVAWRNAHPEVPLDIPFAAITWPVDFYGKLTPSSFREVTSLICAAIDAGRAMDLIIIDTMSRATPGADENSSQDMTTFINNMDLLRNFTSAAVMIVHHHGKTVANGARGHSSLFAAVDTEITVEYDKESRIATANVTKQRDLPTQGTLTYRLRVVEVGYLADGTPVTSCVIEPADATAAKPKGQGPRLGKDAQIGLRLLRKAIDEAGQPPVASDRFPPGALTVSVDVWRRYFYTGTAKDDDPDPKKRGEAQRKQFQRARADLQATKVIDIWADEVCLLGSG